MARWTSSSSTSRQGRRRRRTGSLRRQTASSSCCGCTGRRRSRRRSSTGRGRFRASTRCRSLLFEQRSRSRAESGHAARGRAPRPFLPFFRGETNKGPREEIFYFRQGGELNGVRWNDWKVNFAVLHGNIADAVPVQQKLKAFLLTLPDVPFQQGSSLNAAKIYTTLQAMQAMKRLHELQSLHRAT